MADTKDISLETRLRAVEDKLAIYDLLAIQPPLSDSGASESTGSLFSRDGEFALPDGRGSLSVSDIERFMRTDDYRRILDGGLAHFSSHPLVRVHKDSAVAFNYLQLLLPRQDGEMRSVPGLGASKGYFVLRVAICRWDIVRTANGWRVRKRTAQTLDGSPAAQALLKEALQP